MEEAKGWEVAGGRVGGPDWMTGSTFPASSPRARQWLEWRCVVVYGEWCVVVCVVSRLLGLVRRCAVDVAVVDDGVLAWD